MSAVNGGSGGSGSSSGDGSGSSSSEPIDVEKYVVQMCFICKKSCSSSREMGVLCARCNQYFHRSCCQTAGDCHFFKEDYLGWLCAYCSWCYKQNIRTINFQTVHMEYMAYYNCCNSAANSESDKDSADKP